MQTPNFQGVHYWNRLQWAKDNLEPFQTQYCVVYEDDVDKPAHVMHPDPNWMACALQGGIVPPIETILAMKEEAESPDFKKHTLGPVRDAAKPCDAMTEEEAVELINICPKTMSELRSFTFGWKKLILSETLEKILKIIKDNS